MNKRLLIILMIVFTNILGAGAILPVLPLYAVNQFGASIQSATLLTSAFFAAQFFAAPWLGKLSDRYGRRPILIASQIGTVISFIIFIFAQPIGSIIDSAAIPIGLSGGMIILFFARILDGVTGGNITTARAYISDISNPKEITAAMGKIGAAFGLGFIFGPPFGGLMAGISITAPFIGAALISLIPLGMTILILEESHPPENRKETTKVEQGNLRQIVQANPKFLFPLIIGFIQTLAFSAIPPTFALYAERILFPELPQDAVLPRVGLMLAFFGLVSAATQITLIKPLAKRFGERNLILAGAVILSLFMAVMPLTSSPLIAVLIFAPWAFAQGITDPSLQSIITRFGDKKVQGQLLGIYQSAVSLAFIFGPLWSGYIFETSSPQSVYFIGSLILVPGIITGILFKRSSWTS